ncbi:hypothetical protein CcI49_09360 [Frankia sp. CcI49]|uniref:class I SAM-dependent methyltransferase n=1 Tax=Frankia sp. CcI49 TaxID=1745382 RepID=UPI0009788F8E|nr:class I SAM-dependent methyltransferase [Frankia sp. CcI49]ONH60795.1 hypothetical protein CcI49_09360 [Frankia sp. CcI49]
MPAKRIPGGFEHTFDARGLFDRDYLYFYASQLTEARSDAETRLIWEPLELEPGMETLDLACGHGRTANRLAARGCQATGLDTAALFLAHARLDAAARNVSYIEADMRALPWVERAARSRLVVGCR